MSIFSLVLDLIFPKRPDEALLARESPSTFIRFFRPHRYAGTIALASYEQSLVRSAVTENKFHNNEHAGRLLGTLLSEWLQNEPVAPIVLVPVPLGRKRYQERGYNQVARIIAGALEEKSALTTATLLIRRRETTPQVSLGREARFSNMEDALAVKDIDDLEQYYDYHIVLIDDVITTGATLKAARDALLPHLPTHTRVSCVAIAH